MLRNLESAMETHSKEVREFGAKMVSDAIGIKAKRETYYLAQLANKPGSKLGVREYFKAICYTKKYKSLRRILSDMNIAIYQIPKYNTETHKVLQAVAELSKKANLECAEYMSKTIQSLMDGKIDKKEAQTLKNRIHKIINTLAMVLAICDQILNPSPNSVDTATEKKMELAA